MKNYQLSVLIFLFFFTGRLLASSERGILPEGREWRECKVGMVIDCNTLECDSICSAKLAEEKEEKDRERLEEAKELVEQSKDSAQPDQSE
jgi:hypothetical protein